MPSNTFDEIIQHRVGLERLATGHVKAIQKLLDDVQNDIQDQLARKLPGIGKDPRRLKAMLGTIKGIQASAHAVIQADLKGRMVDMAEYEALWAKRLYEAGIGTGTFLNRPTASMLRSIVTSKPFEGEVLKKWASKMETAQLERIARHIRIGLAQGETTQEIISRLRGTRALRFRNGQFAKDMRGAEALVRTATNHVSNAAHYATILANKDLLPYYRWLSVMDARTTVICQTRAGRIWRVGMGPVPPAHWNCRSTIMALGEHEVAHYRNTLEKGMPFDTWLGRQSNGMQNKVLGVRKAELFRKGGMTVRETINAATKRPMRLIDLQNQDAERWKKVFGNKRATASGHLVADRGAGLPKLTFDPSKIGSGAVLDETMIVVEVPIAQVNRLWSYDRALYFKKGSQDLSRRRYAQLQEAARSKKPVPVPYASFDGKKVSFVKGRHSFTYAREAGEKFIPVAMKEIDAVKLIDKLKKMASSEGGNEAIRQIEANLLSTLQREGLRKLQVEIQTLKTVEAVRERLVRSGVPTGSLDGVESVLKARNIAITDILKAMKKRAIANGIDPFVAFPVLNADRALIEALLKTAIKRRGPVIVNRETVEKTVKAAKKRGRAERAKSIRDRAEAPLKGKPPERTDGEKLWAKAWKDTELTQDHLDAMHAMRPVEVLGPKDRRWHKRSNSYNPERHTIATSTSKPTPVRSITHQHEYGHAVDYNGALRGDALSASPEWTGAMEAGGDRIRKAKIATPHVAKPGQLLTSEQWAENRAWNAERLEVLTSKDLQKKVLLEAKEKHGIDFEAVFGPEHGTSLQAAATARALLEGDYATFAHEYFRIANEAKRRGYEKAAMDKIRRELTGINDLIAASTKSEHGWGHTRQYFAMAPKVGHGYGHRNATEAFANWFQLSVSKDRVSRHILKEAFPELKEAGHSLLRQRSTEGLRSFIDDLE